MTTEGGRGGGDTQHGESTTTTRKTQGLKTLRDNEGMKQGRRTQLGVTKHDGTEGKQN